MTEGVLRHKTDSALTSLPGLPLVLQKSLPRRLRVAALTYAAVFIIMLLVHLLEVWLDDLVSLQSAEHYVTMVSCALGAIAIAMWARPSVSVRALHFGGLAFQIIGTFGIAVASIDLPLPAPDTVGYKLHRPA